VDRFDIGLKFHFRSISFHRQEIRDYFQLSFDSRCNSDSGERISLRRERDNDQVEIGEREREREREREKKCKFAGAPTRNSQVRERFSSGMAEVSRSAELTFQITYKPGIVAPKGASS